MLENWLAECFTCIRWNNSWSNMFCVYSGVRQGSVLSPLLFAIYVDDIGKLSDERHVCYFVCRRYSLLSPSVSRLQKLLHDCEDEFEYLDMNINTTKTSCLRIGPRSDKTCINLCAAYMGSGRGWLAGDWLSTGAFSTLLRRPGLRASSLPLVAFWQHNANAKC